MNSENALRELSKRFGSRLVRPSDDAYDTARAVYNAMVQKRPAMIAQCTSTSDVVAALDIARQCELLVAVKGGGHSIAGKSSCDGGLVIDLAPMKDIRVDVIKGTADAQAGLTWGEFDSKTQEFGLATTGGVVSTTGISGLTLGGGLGWLMPKHGMSCDNLLSVDVVTVDGRVLKASAEENADLFWGIRGGGGNFGIVTRLEFRLHSVREVFAGPVIYPMKKAGEMLRFYRDWTALAPEELMTFPAILPGPEGVPVAMIAVGYCGSVGEGQKFLGTLGGLDASVANLVQAMPYTAMQSMFNSYYPPGWFHYWKSDFLRELSDEAIDTIVEFTAKCPTPKTSVVFLEHYHGAAQRVGPAATAFAHRNHRYNLVINAMSPDAADSQKNVAWARRFWEAMRPYSAGVVYVNYLSEEGEGRVAEAYGSNYERLTALKAKYDPTNFLRLNQNIRPRTTERQP